MLLRLVKVFLILLLAFPVLSHAATVSTRDLTAKDEEYLRKNLPKLFERDVDLATLDEAIRMLMSRGYYENVYIDRTQSGNYEVIGKPLRVIEELVFSGVHEVSESELRNLIDIKVGDRFDRKRAVAAGEKIKTYYGEHGFFNTIVELNFQKTSSKNIRLVFDIREQAPCLIKGLIFETPNTDLKQLLNSRFKTLIGRPLQTDRVQRMMHNLEALLIENRYLATEVVGPDARYNPEKTEAYLQIEVREPYRYEFFFEGNHFFSTADIYRALDLNNRERKNVEPPSEGAERLRRAYLEKGFPAVQIETKVVNPPGSYLRRTYYTITEGSRVRIKTIVVQGRISRASKYYQDIILTNSGPLVAKGYYNRQDLETGFKNLITELRNQGYLRAKQLSSRIEFNESRTSVTVYLMLDEGPQTQIRSIDFKGNKYFSSFELAGVTGLETNTALKLTIFEESLQKLKDFYRNQGFLEMKLLNEGEDMIKYNDKGTQAMITFDIYEGPRIRVHAIVVEGNAQTQTRVILKEAGFELGEVLTPQKLDDATTRLRRLGLFTRVDIRTMEEGSNISERTLIISVTEGMPGDFVVGGGVTNERNLTLRGYTGASYYNLWGSARALSARAEVRSNVAKVKYPENEIQVGFMEPFLFNTRTRGRVSLTRKDYVYDYQEFQNDVAVNFTEIVVKNRADFFAERDLTQKLKLNYKVWSLESRENYERYSRCLPKPDDPKDVFNPLKGKCEPNIMQVGTTGPQFDLDYRDNAFMPTRGWFSRWSFDYSDPGIGSSRGVQFYKTDLEVRHYLPIANTNVIWANSIRGGYMRNLSGDEAGGIPSDYTFLLGGIYTIRGFDLSSPNERLPKDGDGVDSDGFGKEWKLGTTNKKFNFPDSNFYLIKTELRFPIKDALGGVIFYDGGAVHVTGYRFRRPYRDAIGFGFRYNTPVGPFAGDIAFKINPEKKTDTQDAESAYRIQISFGTF